MLGFFFSKKTTTAVTVPAVLLDMLKRNSLSFPRIILYSIRLPAFLPALSAVLIASHYGEQVTEIFSFLEARTEDEYIIRKGGQHCSRPAESK